MYVLRLRIEYKDIRDVLTRISIYEDGYAGAPVYRTAASAIKVEWGDQSGQGLPLIYGSSCTIFFESEADYEFLYLFGADNRTHLVIVEKDGQLFWTGFNDPDSWSEPLIAVPYPVECTAYDGLGFLKDIDFVDDAGDAYEGKKTMFELVKICLLKTGLDLPINAAIDWEEEQQAAGTDLMKVHQYNCDRFVGKKCLDVLSELLRKCRIMQRSGEWWIISDSNWKNLIFQYFRTSTSGILTSGVLNPQSAELWQEGEATIEMLPALRQLVVVQDYGYNANLVQNGSFETFNEELATFKGWINNYVTPEQRNLNDDGDKYILIPGHEYYGTLHDEKYGLQTKNIEKQKAFNQTTSVFNISMKYALMGFQASLIFIRVKITGAGGSYYLRRVRYFETSEVPWEWINYNDKESLGDDMICLKSHLKVSAYTGITLPHPYYNTFDNVPAYPADQVIDHFESFKASVTGIPVTGTLSLQLFVPYTNSSNVAGSCFTGIKMELLDEQAEKYPTKKSFKVVNSLRNNYTPDTVTAITGDYPDIVNSDVIYSGGISRLDNSHTTGWRIAGTATYYTHAEFIARLMAAEMRTPRQNYVARLADLIPRLNLVVIDDNNPGKRFVENGISYTDDYQLADGRWTEIIDIDFSGQTVETAETFEDASSNTQTVVKTPANPVNIEERVAVMDLKSAVISAPGYLDAEYFEGDTSEEDGFTRIRPNFFDSGRFSPASRAVERLFLREYSEAPVGRKNVHVYRTVEPEAGVIIDQDVLFHSLVVTTTGFTLTIDPAEDLTGVNIEYTFYLKNTL